MKLNTLIVICLVLSNLFLLFQKHDFDKDNEKAKVSLIKNSISIDLNAVKAMDGKDLESMVHWLLVNKSTRKIIVADGSGDETKVVLTRSKTPELNNWYLIAESNNYSGVAHLTNSDLNSKNIEIRLSEKENKLDLIVPEKVVATLNTTIKWQLPKYIDAKINVQKKDKKPNFYKNPSLYTVNSKTNDAKLRIPGEPGKYVVRLFDIKNSKKALLEKEIEVLKVEIKLDYPSEVLAGTSFDVKWNAPEGVVGQINLKPESEKASYFSRAKIKTKSRTKGTFIAPSKEGDYVMRWHDLYSRQLISEYKIKVIKPVLKLMVKEKASVGEKLLVKWQVPDNLAAKVYLRSVDDDSQQKVFSTSIKTEVEIVMPNNAGLYYFSWVSDGDKQEMMRRNIEVTSEKINEN